MVDASDDISCAIIVVKKNGSLGGRYELDKRRWCILGNHDDCDIRIDSKKVAPLQALVSMVDGKVILEGLDPDIPMVVPNVASLYKGDKHRVKDEESFFIGNRLFRFSIVPSGKKPVALETESQAAINDKMNQASRCSSRKNSSSSAVPHAQKSKRRTSLLVTDTDELIVNARMSGNLFPVSRLETPSKDISAQFANDPPRVNDTLFTPQNTQKRSIGGMKINLAYAFEEENVEPKVHAQVTVASKDDAHTEEAEHTTVPPVKGEFKGSNSQTSSVTAQGATTKTMGVSDSSPASSADVAQAESTIKKTVTSERKELTSGSASKSPSARQKLIYARLSQGLPATPLRQETASQPSAISQGPKLTPMRKQAPGSNSKSALFHSSANKKIPKPWSSAASAKPYDPKVSQSEASEPSSVPPSESLSQTNVDNTIDQTWKSSPLHPKGVLSRATEKSAPSPRRKSVLFARSIELEAGPHYSPIRMRMDEQSQTGICQAGVSINRNFRSHPQPSPASEAGGEGRLQERIPGPPPNEQLGLLGEFSYPLREDPNVSASIRDESEQSSTSQSESTEESDTEKVSAVAIAEAGSSKRTSGNFGEGLANFWRKISGGQAEPVAEDKTKASIVDNRRKLGERSNSNALSTSNGSTSSGFETTDEIAECTPDTSNCSGSDGDLADEDASWYSDESGIAEEIESQLSGSVDLDSERLDELEYTDDDGAMAGSDHFVAQGFCDDAYDEDGLDRQDICERTPEQHRDGRANEKSSEVANVLTKTNCSIEARTPADDSESACDRGSNGPETPVVEFPLDYSESTENLTTPERPDDHSDMSEEIKTLGGSYMERPNPRLSDPELQAVNSYALSSSSEDYSVNRESSEEEVGCPDNQENTAEVDEELCTKSNRPASVNSGSSTRRISLMDTVFNVAKAVTKRFSAGHASSGASGATGDDEEEIDFDPEDLETASESSEEFVRDNEFPEGAMEQCHHHRGKFAVCVEESNEHAQKSAKLGEQVFSDTSANSKSAAKIIDKSVVSTTSRDERENLAETKALSTADYRSEAINFSEDDCEDRDKIPEAKEVDNEKTEASYRLQSDNVFPNPEAKQSPPEDKDALFTNISTNDAANPNEVVKGVSQVVEPSNAATVLDERLWVGDVPVKELGTKTVAVLRKLLRDRDLHTAGNKAALVKRLTEHARPTAVTGGAASAEPADEAAADRVEGDVDTIQNVVVKVVSGTSINERCSEVETVSRSFSESAKCEKPIDEVKAENSGRTTELLERSESVSTMPNTVDINEQPSVDRSLYRKKTVKELQWLLRSCLTRTPGRLRKEELINSLIANGIGPDGALLQTGVVSTMERCSNEQTEMFKTPRTSNCRARNFATPLQNSKLDFDEISAPVSGAESSGVSTRGSRSRPVANFASGKKGEDGMDLLNTPTEQATRAGVSARETGKQFVKSIAEESMEKSTTKASRITKATAVSDKSDKTPAAVEAVANDSVEKVVENEGLNGHSTLDSIFGAKHVNSARPNIEEDGVKGEETISRSVRRSTRKATKSSKARKATRSTDKENDTHESKEAREGDCPLTHSQEPLDHSVRTLVESKTPSKKGGRSHAKGSKEVKLERLTVVVLRQMLQEAGLCQSGVKNVLIARLNRSDGRDAKRVDEIKDSCDGCRNGEACVLGGGKR